MCRLQAAAIRWLMLHMMLEVAASFVLHTTGTAAASCSAAATASCGAAASPKMMAGLFDRLAANIQQLGSTLTDTSSPITARISHVMLRTDDAALNYRTKGECYELLSVWKERIDNDEEKFAICARERSECQSRERGGDLGFVTPREAVAFKTRAPASSWVCVQSPQPEASHHPCALAVTREKLASAFSEVVFVDDAVAAPGCYGPVVSEQGLHLVYVHATS